MFSNIIATSENGIIIYGDAERSIENITFSNLDLEIVRGREMMTYGGNFDLRPAADIKKQIFEHDIPGIYAMNVDGLTLDHFRLEWGLGLAPFYTHGIWCESVNDLWVSDFWGGGNPGVPEAEDIYIVNSIYRK